MNYKLDYTIEKVLNNKNTSDQTFIKTIQDHKWYLSERLGRDVGLFVAALDYFLNDSTTPNHA